ncbi:type II secretion system F family protein [Candidatus Nitrosotenuis uzonensis]|nr:type II secretion system F family protein [Candidatus Nitrosotenuis uzonensis]
MLKSKQYEKSHQPSGFQVFSYRLLNRHIGFLYTRLTDLRDNIRQAMMPIPYEVYVASMVLSSMIAMITGIVVAVIALSYFNVDTPVTLLLGAMAGLVLSVMVFFGMQAVPVLNSKNRSAKLSEEIPHYIGYMATLCASGLSLEGVFKSIAKESSDEEIVKDSKFVTRNVEILGMDILTAINDLIKRTPKGPYSELLEGAIITFKSGGNLREYFLATAKVHLEEKKLNVKRSTESLGILAEMYTILLIVFPLMAVIMLSIMAIMNPNLGGFDLLTLMNMLTYVMVPLFGIVLLILMNSMVPKR